VAGPASEGKTFEEISFNDHYPTTHPLTGQPKRPVPFYDVGLDFSVPSGVPLPHLDLERVFILTGPGTCSASEAVMNGLAGIGVDVIQIGTTTCGKPYAFWPWDNCGTTYFAIQMQGVNHAGFGDYTDGFTPGGSDPAGLPGCVVADDFTRELGDPSEARLAAALAYRDSGTCPSALSRQRQRSRLSAIDGEIVKSPVLQNRIYTSH